MKKNNAMRLASALLVLVLLTTSIVGGTFAKYTTTANSNDTARVAKWGVTVTATNDSVFKTTYGKDDANTNITQTVDSSNSDKVIAPGTSGNLTKVTLSGSPEVAVKVSYTGTLTLVGWTIGTEFYCPLKITINTTTLCGLDYASADAFATAVSDVIATCSKEYEPNTDLSGKAGEVMSISWAWSFTDSGTYLNGAQQKDAKDTALGNTAATGTAPAISLVIVTTVTQID